MMMMMMMMGYLVRRLLTYPLSHLPPHRPWSGRASRELGTARSLRRFPVPSAMPSDEEFRRQLAPRCMADIVAFKMGRVLEGRGGQGRAGGQGEEGGWISRLFPSHHRQNRLLAILWVEVPCRLLHQHPNPSLFLHLDHAM